MRCIFLVCFLVFQFGCYNYSNGQESNTQSYSRISGIVKDSGLDFNIHSATVSIYKEQDNKLLQYTLTNALGEFVFAKLPSNEKLVIQISCVGYVSYRSVIFITQESLNLNTVFLEKSITELDSIIITPPPVRVHGDTLEFNASAFAMGPNAVAEDLLKKLPGVIVWNDGVITINGKQINKLLVNGKSFFGSEARVVTQNLPKSAIDKIQVYQEFVDPYNPFDSITSINIKLRKNAQRGFFGMDNVVVGTDKRNEFISSHNYYTPRDQFALVGQYNNTNKLVNSTQQLLRNTTYKSNSGQVDYQSDFNKPGQNRQFFSGIMHLHDFGGSYKESRHVRLFNDFSFSRFLTDINRNSETISAIGNADYFFQNSNSNSSMDFKEIIYASQLLKKTTYDSLLFGFGFNQRNENSKNEYEHSIIKNQNQNLSSGTQDEGIFRDQQNFNVKALWNHQGFYNSNVSKLTNWKLLYEGSVKNQNLVRNNNVFFDYSGLGIPSLNYIRNYQNQRNGIINHLNFELGNLSSLIFSKNRILSKFSIRIINDLVSESIKDDYAVSDFDSTAQHYLFNKFVSRDYEFKYLLNKAGLIVTRSFFKGLANRYDKSYSINYKVEFQTYDERFVSLYGSSNNFLKRYRDFLHKVYFSYSNHQYSEYYNQLNVGFSKFVNFPTLDQRLPLVDSSDFYLIRNINTQLVPSSINDLQIQFEHSNRNTRQPVASGISLNVGIIENYITDSLVIKQTGQNFAYPINLRDYKYLKTAFSFKSTLVFPNQQLQLKVVGSGQISHAPTFITFQAVPDFSVSKSLIKEIQDSVVITYTYKDILAFSFEQYFNKYDVVQMGNIESKFKNSRSTIKLGLTWNITGRITFNTNLSLNSVNFTNSRRTNFNLLNSFVAMRLFRKENFELKASAFDILNQNRGVLLFGNNFSVTKNNVNMLKQYFSLGITFFPRNFKIKGTKR